MTEVRIIVQGVADPPLLEGRLNHPIREVSPNVPVTVVLIEQGMASGEPAVLICASDPHGSVVISTSLDKLMMAASFCAGAAESRWGWQRPDGSATLMPPDRATRKALLESIRKELSEWDEVAS